MQSSEERLIRIETTLERSTNLLEQVIQIQERVISAQGQQDDCIQILVDAATRHEAAIAMLDAILARMSQREERKDNS